ncbi:SRPBCC domain-containing protein [Chitinophaga sp. 22321]|uniref:SRPBCC domain-containing protein n=1 Tax=Chitinophaga hostae TaxID=2831022 RepID=A0ABS5IWQ7_9BACT|nr:SRPBCC domain-containing protein [Chitinophaga hostae]MBS0027310.1 SRPBCC domain-containing protein [Chitinophaga hostae]
MNPPGQLLTATVSVQASMTDVWACWTTPEHICQWNSPSADWHTSHVENDVRRGGRFLFTMQLKNNSSSFDFGGVYTEVRPQEKISYTLTDGRQTVNLFAVTPEGINVTEIFEPENGLPANVQLDFTTGVLNNFKSYVENVYKAAQLR